jgi:hypothetical protein
VAEKVRFQTNIWESPLALKYPEGKEVDSQFDPSGRQFMYSLTDGRIMFLSPRDADVLNSLCLQAEEEFEAARVEVQEGRRKFTKFEARRINPPAKPGANLPDRPQVLAGAEHSPSGNAYPDHSTPKPNGNGNGNGHHGAAPAPERPKTKLEDALKTVVDAIHQATAYAKEIGYQMPPFSSEDIRTMANTLMIQNGGAR